MQSGHTCPFPADPSMPTAAQVTFWGNVNDPNSGGVEKIMVTCGLHFREFKPVILSRGPQGLKTCQGIPSYNFQENKLRNRICNKILGLKRPCYDGLIQVLRELRPDVLHFHNRPEYVDALARKLAHRPLVVCHLHLYYDRYAMPKRADLFIANSPSVAEHFKKQFKPSVPVAVAGNPIPFDFTNLDGARLGNATPIRRFFFAGGGSPHKGAMEVMEAFARFVGDHPKAELIVCGPSCSNIQRSIPGVQVLGQISPALYREQISRADAFISAAHFEPFGVGILEAMAVGLPVIASKNAGIFEFIGTEPVLSVEPKNAASLLAAMETVMLEAPEARDERILAAHVASRRFTGEQIASEMEAHYLKHRLTEK